MDLPLHEQLRFDQWRRMVRDANHEQAQQIALMIIDYAQTHRALILAMMLPNAQQRF
jgi:hypothetical protein